MRMYYHSDADSCIDIGQHHHPVSAPPHHSIFLVETQKLGEKRERKSEPQIGWGWKKNGGCWSHYIFCSLLPHSNTLVTHVATTKAPFQKDTKKLKMKHISTPMSAFDQELKNKSCNYLRTDKRSDLQMLLVNILSVDTTFPVLKCLLKQTSGQNFGFDGTGRIYIFWPKIWLAEYGGSLVWDIDFLASNPGFNIWSESTLIWLHFTIFPPSLSL